MVIVFHASQEKKNLIGFAVLRHWRLEMFLHASFVAFGEGLEWEWDAWAKQKKKRIRVHLRKMNL